MASVNPSNPGAPPMNVYPDGALEGGNVDPLMQTTPTVEYQYSDYVAGYTCWVAKLLSMGTGTYTRVKPGELKLKKHNTFQSMFYYYNAIMEYNGDLKIAFFPEVWQFFLLFGCNIFHAFNEEPAYMYTPNGTRYCYDNIYADLYLNGGDRPDGIYGWIDVFTFEGWFWVWIVGILRKTITSLIFNALVGVVFGLIWTTDLSKPLCIEGSGDWKFKGLPFVTLDLCQVWNYF